MNEKIIINNSINKKKNFMNIGIRILRILLSFMVVLDHFYNKKKAKKIHYVLYYHIPTFFLISFFFTYRTLISQNIDKIKLRFERLLIPYFCWSFIAWLIKNIHYYIMKEDCAHTFKDFIINLINGHIFNVVLWFQNILILLTLLFSIIILLFYQKYLQIFQSLLILSYFLQYSGLNYKIFKKNFSSHSRSTFGRFFEALPNAITGFFFAYINLIEIIIIQKKQFKIFCFSLIILILISKYEIFAELKTFKYGGIRLNIAAICIFNIFSLIPTNLYLFNLNNNIIMTLTNYTGGIYFTHYLVGKGYICGSIKYVKNGTILGCFFIYLISYILSFFGFKFFGKTKLRHLFI